MTQTQPLDRRGGRAADRAERLPSRDSLGCSANPARAFGIFPRKGAIAIGSDADLVVVDPTREQMVSPAVPFVVITPETSHLRRRH
jgi:alpha-D-ribose 1-methylphosphonate 5-triphosphate diphosphatase PhnM